MFSWCTEGCNLGLDLVDVVKGTVKLKTRCSSDTSKNDACKYSISFILSAVSQNNRYCVLSDYFYGSHSEASVWLLASAFIVFFETTYYILESTYSILVRYTSVKVLVWLLIIAERGIASCLEPCQGIHNGVSFRKALNGLWMGISTVQKHYLCLMLCCLLFHWWFSFLSTIPLFEMTNNEF